MVFDHTAPRLLTTRGYAYLKVAEGCNNPCTFCAIPLWRGRFRSRTIASLVDEARQLEAQGVGELCLIAQDTTRYGEDLDYGKHGLTRLAEALLASTGFKWIRFLYAYPTTLDEQLLKLMGQEERLVSYVDMPLQHSHPDMLKAMRRGGSAERYTRLLERARELAPDIFLRTTFIVGFPGRDRRALRPPARLRPSQPVRPSRRLRLQRRSRGHRRQSSPDPVAPAIARRRHRRLLAAQKPIALARRRALVGRTFDCLVEGVSPETEHLLEGRHYGMAPEIDGRLLINDGAAPAGTFARVEITDAFASDLVGRIVGPVDTPGVEIAASVA